MRKKDGVLKERSWKRGKIKKEGGRAHIKKKKTTRGRMEELKKL